MRTHTIRAALRLISTHLENQLHPKLQARTKWCEEPDSNGNPRKPADYYEWENKYIDELRTLLGLISSILEDLKPDYSPSMSVREDANYWNNYLRHNPKAS